MRYLLWTLLLIIAYLPQRINNALINILTKIRVLLSRKEKRILYRNVEEIFKLRAGSDFARMFLDQVFYTQICIYFENIRAILRPHLLRIDGIESFAREMQRRCNAGQGQISFSAHLGSFELIGITHHLAGLKFHALAKPASQPWFNACLDKLRRRMGIGVLWTNDPSLSKNMLRTLEQGDILGFVCDQKPKGRKGPVVDFFGQQTMMPVGPAAMAIKKQCGVVGIFCVRKGPMHYAIHWESVADNHHGLSDVNDLTQKITTCMEKYIRLYPEQWYWNYRRWRFT